MVKLSVVLVAVLVSLLVVQTVGRQPRFAGERERERRHFSLCHCGAKHAVQRSSQSIILCRASPTRQRGGIVIVARLNSREFAGKAACRVHK